MTMPGVSCKAVATQNSSEWPCSMCPIPPWLRLVGVRTSYIYFSNISWTPWALDPITNPFLGTSSWLHPASYWKQSFNLSGRFWHNRITVTIKEDGWFYIHWVTWINKFISSEHILKSRAHLESRQVYLKSPHNQNFLKYPKPTPN